ncbi:COP9 signalosome complex subunit 7b-like [Watersipora subatra]|uniref:COP9 signalosome complex subunit 7b-like n=1 Tax=Watersipora subatra TaxID=2589382 RepID=UPI00355B2AC7
MSGEVVTNPALEQFLLLAKSTKGAGAVALIKQVLGAPNLYVFSELLECSSIQQLDESPDYKPYVDLLRIFAYGTCTAYIARKHSLPELSPQMIKKLRHLTIASLATKCKHIPYSLLLKELDLHNVRELEDLIIEAIYAGVIKARMDQNHQRLEVNYVIGRDVEKSKLPELLNILERWTQACTDNLEDITTQLTAAQEARAAETKRKLQAETEVANIKKTLKLTSTERTGVRSSSEAMDVEGKAKKLTKIKGLRGSATKIFGKVSSG